MQKNVMSARGRTILYAVLILFAVIQVYPIIWVILQSIKTTEELTNLSALSLPSSLYTGHFKKALEVSTIPRSFLNSTIVAVVTLTLEVAICCPFAFAVRKLRWKGGEKVFNFVLLGMMIPIHATLLPNYKIYNTLGLTDTIWALLIPYVAFSLPQGLFLMTGFIDSIPWEMEEAAVMDGCGIYRIVFQIITPMLKPSIATVAIMTFLNNWNEFIMASTYLSTPKWKTLPFSVLEFTGQYSSNYAVQFAVMALTAAPAVIVYILLNKHITKGVAMGAVKG